MLTYRSVLAAALFACASLPASAAFIDTGLAVTDFSAPSAFVFTFNSPYVGGPFTLSSLQYDLTVTDGGRDGASLTGTIDGEVDGVVVTSLALSCTVPVEDGVENGVMACGDSTSAPILSLPAGEFKLLVSFNLSGNDDQVAMTARHEITNGDSAVPEPSAVILGASGLGLLAILRRRQRGA